jgi:polyhydroxyalkanoate synthesis regulator phasin
MDENKEFMQDWLKEGKKNWNINQKKRADAIARVKYFEDKEVKAYKDRLTRLRGS